MWEGIKDWYQRARQVMDGRDLLMLTPPGVISVLLEIGRQRREGSTDPDPGCGLDDFDPALIDVFADLFRAIGRYYFRLRVTGVENVPAEGGALLVGNHNGGVLTFDSLFTALAVYDHLGPRRLVRGLAHDAVFTHPIVRRYAKRLGILRARPEIAEQALRAGWMALVYPGSDWDACRSFSDRNRIVLAGRRGFIRLALRTGVPIVPVVSVGTHEQLIILTRGDRLARLFGFDRLLRTNTLPIALALPWGLTSPILPYLPLPAQTSIAFGEPLRFPDVRPEQADDPEVQRRCYDVVEGRMQAMLDELSAGRVPFLGKLGS